MNLLLIGLGFGLLLLALWFGLPLLMGWQADRRRRQIIQERLLAQARIDALTRATVAAMRAEVRWRGRRSQ